MDQGIVNLVNQIPTLAKYLTWLVIAGVILGLAIYFLGKIK